MRVEPKEPRPQPLVMFGAMLQWRVMEEEEEKKKEEVEVVVTMMITIMIIMPPEGNDHDTEEKTINKAVPHVVAVPAAFQNHNLQQKNGDVARGIMQNTTTRTLMP